ncbi:serine/threonine-protein kinase [Pseudonocardia sp. ICBG162]|uniref:serine/threonine-protein kinase n=1 Tax=Pseudonocardia sp. ICBG162 TaxID=2846761 RepID=UPI001CF64C59|nr:serine/threonine-protein kinase [Pseudonocardia sp. ICBG162]
MFGHYRIEGVLGRGGMGEVSRAYDTRTERVVALKRLRPELADEPEYRSRFQRESRTAARLSSPHVIPIHNVGEIDGRLFIDMRLVAGRDLAEAVRESGALDPHRVVRLVGQVADALHAAHADGLVHRDVKPSNVLLADGDRDFAYLVDFGIAKSTDAGTGTALTGTGTAIGTLAYMAPELFLGAAADRRVDVYALACLTYEALSGAAPFRAEGPALMYQHLGAERPRISAVRPELADADDVLVRGMAVDPDERFATAPELAAALAQALGADPERSTASGPTRVLSGIPSQAPAPGSGPVRVAAPGSGPVPVAAGAAAGAVGVAGAAGTVPAAAGVAASVGTVPAPAGTVPGAPGGTGPGGTAALWGQPPWGQAGHDGAAHGPWAAPATPPGGHGVPPGLAAPAGLGGPYSGPQGPWVPPQPRRRTHPALVAVTAVLATVVLGFGALMVVGTVLEDPAGGTAPPAPTAAPAAAPTTAPAAAPASAAPAATTPIPNREADLTVLRQVFGSAAAPGCVTVPADDTGYASIASIRCEDTTNGATVFYDMWSDAGDARAFYDHVRAGASLPPGSDTWSSGDDATVQGPFFSRGPTLSRNAVAVALCADTRFSIYVVAPTQEQAQAGFAATTTAPASEIPR